MKIIKNLAQLVWNKFTYLISPPFCEGCKAFIKERTIFCDSCFNKIMPVVSYEVKLNSKYNIKVFAVSDYKDPIKPLILAKSRSYVLASNYLGQLIWNMTNIANLEFDYLVPIPLHWTRQIKRGYNQTEIIANELAKKSNKPVLNILQRHKATKYQYNLNYPERLNNLKQAFTIATGVDIKDKDIIIVDDLFTSGSTIINAAKEIAKLKPRSITAVVAARVC